MAGRAASRNGFSGAMGESPARAVHRIFRNHRCWTAARRGRQRQSLNAGADIVNINSLIRRRKLLLATVVAAGAIAAVGISLLDHATAEGPTAKPEQAMPASVAVVEKRDAAIWNEFSGRLEA